MFAWPYAISRRATDTLARSAVIENYQETLIRWETLPEPVGIKIEFDLLHPAGMRGLIYPPQIRMGKFIDVPDSKLFLVYRYGAGYFDDYHLNEKSGRLMLLKPVVWQYMHPKEDDKRFDPDSTRTHLAYYLYPGVAERIDSAERLCMDSVELSGRPRCLDHEQESDGCVRIGDLSRSPVYHQGNDVSALWGVADIANADLSRLMTVTLQQKSILQHNPELWIRIQRQFRPRNLKKAGYTQCFRERGLTEICFCK